MILPGPNGTDSRVAGPPFPGPPRPGPSGLGSPSAGARSTGARRAELPGSGIGLYASTPRREYGTHCHGID